MSESLFFNKEIFNKKDSDTDILVLVLQSF